MKRTPFRLSWLVLALSLLWLSASTLDAAPPAQQPSAESVAGEMLIGIKPDIVSVSDIHTRSGAQIVQVIGGRRPTHRVRLPRNQTFAQVAAAYRRDPRVAFVEPNYIAYATLPAPNDPSYADGTQWPLSKIKMLEAWSIFPNVYYDANNKPRNTVKIAIIDSGIDIEHNDFKNVGGDSTNAAQGGQIDRANSWDFVNNDNNPADDQGHGTHVSGIAAAATNNGLSYTVDNVARGVSGVAYHAQIISIKTLGRDGSGTYGNIANAIVFAADRGALIINLSLSGPAYSQALQNAINYAWSKGSLVVAAAGNSGNGAAQYPAANNYVLGVAATDLNDARAGFSSFGAWVGIAAPGANVFSTLPTQAVNANLPRYYGNLSGTSMAAPHVAGLAALYASRYGITQSTSGGNAEIWRALQQSADNIANTANGGWSQEFGYGRINAERALGGAPLRPATVGSIIGQALEDDGTPISGATVRAGTRTTTTNANGVYRIANLPVGNYNVSITAPGYSFPTQVVSVPPGADVNATFAQTPNPTPTPIPPTPTPVPPTPTPVPPTPTPIPGGGSTWYFAEGSTQSGFSTFLLLANPNSFAVPATITYFKEDAQTIVRTYLLLPTSRRNIWVNSEVPGFALSMKVESPYTIFAERAQYSQRDGHASQGISAPSQTWYFAEGATTANFQTWILLQNPNGASAQVALSFLKEDGNIVTHNVTLDPTSRRNILANLIVPNAAIATTVTSNLPIVAERAMYFGTGSHGATGVTAPRTTWYLAEGFTGSGYDTWLLLANPNPIAAQANVNFMKDDGTVTTRTFTVGARSRLNIYANSIVPNTAFATRITSDQPLVVERAMYFGPSTARGGHNAQAADAPAHNWYLAEGSSQGSFSTYILLMNPNNVATNVTVRFLKEDGTTVIRTYNVRATSRFTIWANAVVSNAAFSTEISADQPIVVERAMYFNNQSGGTAALGIAR